MNLMSWIYCSILVVFLLTGCNEQAISTDEQVDPVLVEYPVVYIERSINRVSDDDLTPVTFSPRNPAQFNAGARLIIKNNAFADSPSTTLTSELFTDEQGETQAIDIRDLSVSADGQSFLISIRAPEIADADENEQPKWNIWRYQLADKSFQRIITSDVVAEQGDDLMASFLPDGRIIFASTRQRLSRAILLDEGKPQYTALNESGQDSAFNLHIMQADGSDIKQVSFNMSHDLYPLVLQDGRILYSRWDTMGGNNKINLYRMNPDGTDNQLVYGWHSHQITLDDENHVIEFVKAQQMPNGDILLLVASTDDEIYQKRPMLINIGQFIDNQQAIDNEVVTSSAQSAAQKDLFTDSLYNFNFSDEINTAGRLSHLFPLPDSSERYLLSWDLCRVTIDAEIKACGQLSEQELAQEGLELASPWYELWLYNGKTNTQQVVAKTTEGYMLSEAIVMQASDNPATFVADKSFGAGLTVELANEQAAAIHIRSVYDMDGVDSSIQATNPLGIISLRDPALTTAAQLPARFLRIVRGVPLPPDEVREISNTDFGRSRNQLMREIIGYTPIQPDGSVKVKLPANVPFAISVLDANGQRIGGRHRQWLSVKAGETLECHGCHTGQSELPHGRPEAQPASINAGANLGGVAFSNANPDIIPLQAQTMAEADEMVNGLAQLSADIRYIDKWTNSDISALNPEINYSYQELATQAPAGSDCFNNWNAYCRLQINYVAHIQPLWQLPRQVFDEQTAELLSDNTCSSCHSPLDSDNLAQVPAGQLDLSDSVSIDEVDHLTAYRELMFNDAEQEVIDGIVIDKLIEVLDANGNIVFELDAQGELILDAAGNPIPVLTNITIPAVLSTNGANQSSRFFDLFKEGRHKDMLSVHELRLLSEWLDIGGQYYNTPFYSQD
ncbi:hypothetical protein [Colwellia psychrerythraea]|uniref:Hydrazine synthase alpha subunit middle domain-containing protein n=1 Tax=Colwellia psychrerythraea TaxID=28229 RepID=A0A099KYW3_COLPS|nr:hypothetical protein [Colwellia psychrerythraea]KGJ95017.1 hypothetical protein GAB14E_2251 [Colwellia psychrerythraea]